jgi:hypothetical protein
MLDPYAYRAKEAPITPGQFSRKEQVLELEAKPEGEGMRENGMKGSKQGSLAHKAALGG